MNQTSYRSQSRVFLAQASEELEKDDLRQASEKGWGAAAEILKAVAAERGWGHHSHRSLYDAVDLLVAETGDQDIRLQFTAGGQLHTNFYEGWFSEAAVEVHLREVTRFVERLEGLLAAS